MSGWLPTDVANQALDAIAWDSDLGDLQDGSREGNVCLRAYRQNLMQLLRAAHWSFARVENPLLLLGDSTGQTPNVSSYVNSSQFVYAYAYPNDCVAVRYIPWTQPGLRPGIPPNNIQVPAAPFTTGGNQPPFIGIRPRPAPFLVTMDVNYPVPPGTMTWETQGVSPQGRTVILTNVQNAQCVYTMLALYPNTWDALFRAAMVAYLASEIAMPLWGAKDRKFAIECRNAQITIAKQKITEARIRDGNENWLKADISVDWMQTRRVGESGVGNWGGGIGNGWGGPGFAGGWSQCSFSDGSAY